jgi:hypothetical protein
MFFVASVCDDDQSWRLARAGPLFDKIEFISPKGTAALDDAHAWVILEISGDMKEKLD